MKDPLDKELSEWFREEIKKAKANPDKYIKDYLGEPYKNENQSIERNPTEE